MDEEYVLEYNKNQDAFHIQTIESREEIPPIINTQWKILAQGSYDEILKARDIISKFEEMS